MESWILRVSFKVYVKLFWLHLLCKRPEVFMILWTFKKSNSFLIWIFCVITCWLLIYFIHFSFIPSDCWYWWFHRSEKAWTTSSRLYASATAVGRSGSVWRQQCGTQCSQLFWKGITCWHWERSGSVVECLTQDRGAAGVSLTCVTVLCAWARHIYPSLVLVQPRKTRPYITERLLMGRKESNQTFKPSCFNKVTILWKKVWLCYKWNADAWKQF